MTNPTPEPLDPDFINDQLRELELQRSVAQTRSVTLAAENGRLGRGFTALKTLYDQQTAEIADLKAALAELQPEEPEGTEPPGAVTVLPPLTH